MAWKNYGIKKNSAFVATSKNTICGDKIKLELSVKDLKNLTKIAVNFKLEVYKQVKSEVLKILN